MKLYKFLTSYWPVFIITLLGALFRFTNLNWDMGGRLHPDEALIVNGALEIIWPVNLFHGFHDYNGFSVYLLKLFSFGTHSATTMTFVGREISATLSTLTIIAIFYLGKKIWNTNVGMLASLLFAFAPISIQLAHFYTTENIMVFVFTLLGIASATYWESPKMKNIIFMGISSGLLIATKNTGYLFLPIPILTIIVRKMKLTPIFLFGLVCLITFFVTSPYSFLDFHRYFIRSQYLSDVVSGKLLMDWTIQFQHTNGLFWIKNLVVGFGPMIIFGLVGCVVAWIKRKKIQISTDSIFSLWSLGFITFLCVTYLKFIRYSAPLLPFISLFSAQTLWSIKKTRLGSILTLLTIFIQIIWGAMYYHIYLTPHTSLTARDWITNNIPTHSIIVRETWNNVVHFDATPLLQKQYGFISINLYTQPDSKEKFEANKTILENANYFISESPKIKNTINRLVGAYPYSNKIYNSLQDGSLGYKQIAQFSSYPQLGPLILNDELTEETFTVFDHPTITVFKNINK